MLLWNVDHLNDARHLIVFRLTWEYGIPNVQFSHYATEAPHINGASIGYSKHNFWGTIEPGLYIGVDTLV